MRGGARPAGGKASIWPALYRAISERSEIAARHSLSVSCGDHHVQMEPAVARIRGKTLIRSSQY